MPKGKPKRLPTDEEVKKKAVKLVITHLRKKIVNDFIGKEHVEEWLVEMDELLKSPDFVYTEYSEMRHNFNDVIDSILDVEIRYKLRDSWYSFGKALEKKAKKKI